MSSSLSLSISFAFNGRLPIEENRFTPSGASGTGNFRRFGSGRSTTVLGSKARFLLAFGAGVDLD